MMMTDDPTTHSQEPPREAPSPKSFGELDGYIDGLHNRIRERAAKEKSIAFEIISMWQELLQVMEHGWYTRYECETFADYCERFYGYDEEHISRYHRIGRLPAQLFQGCTLPKEALRWASVHFKGPALEMLAAGTKRVHNGNQVIRACRQAAALNNEAKAAEKLREWLVEGKAIPRPTTADRPE